MKRNTTSCFLKLSTNPNDKHLPTTQSFASLHCSKDFPKLDHTVITWAVFSLLTNHYCLSVEGRSLLDVNKKDSKHADTRVYACQIMTDSEVSELQKRK